MKARPKSMVILVLVAAIIGGTASTLLAYRLTYAFGPNAPYASYINDAICSGANLPAVNMPVQSGFPLRSRSYKKDLLPNCASKNAISLGDFYRTPELYYNAIFWFAMWCGAGGIAVWAWQHRRNKPN